MPAPRATPTPSSGAKRKTAPASATKGAQRGPIATAAAQPVQRVVVDVQARRMMVAEAAYYRAEKRGFVPGNELQDWLEAEAEVEAMLPP